MTEHFRVSKTDVMAKTTQAQCWGTLDFILQKLQFLQIDKKCFINDLKCIW